MQQAEGMMATHLRLLLVAGILVSGLNSLASAEIVSLLGVADGDSRLFEANSDAFAQLDRGYLVSGTPDPAIDGFFRISAEAGISIADLGTFDAAAFNPVVFEQNLAPAVSGGIFSPFDAFPNEENFVLGNLSVDASSATGVGTEVFAVASYTDLDFSANIFPGPYATELSNVTGSVTFEDGVLSMVDLASEIGFVFDSPIGPVTFSGSFEIADNEFALFVDDTLGSTRLIFDSTGTVVATVVPEPGPGLILALGSVFGATRHRKRQG